MTTPAHGLDISEFQGTVDYAALLAAHPAMVGIRVSFGTQAVDARFAANRAGLSGKVPLLLLYHFAYPDVNGGITGARAEANHFCDAVGSLRPGEYVTLDWERAYSGDHVAWVDAWWTVVETRLGVKRPDEWEYGSASTLYQLRTDPESAQRHLWLALYPTGGGDPNNPPAPPPGFTRVDIWQHGGGQWPGVAGTPDDDWVYTQPATPSIATGATMLCPRPKSGQLDALAVWTDGGIRRRWAADLGHIAVGDQGEEVLAALPNGETPKIVYGAWNKDETFFYVKATTADGTAYVQQLDVGLGKWSGWLAMVGWPEHVAKDGAPGQPGQPGQPGTPGVPPTHTHTASVTIDGVSVPVTTGPAQ